jgi:hypothetical protein
MNDAVTAVASASGFVHPVVEKDEMKRVISKLSFD